MSFLRENAFLVITAGVLLVFSVVALVWANSASGTADGRAELRTKLSRDINSQARDPVNEKVVNQAKENVLTLRRYRQEVAADFLTRSAVYRVLRFTEKYLGKGQTADAFPIRDDLYEGKGMRKQFPARYLESLDGLLAALDVTRPPTSEEIQDQLERIKAKMGPTTPRMPGFRPGMRPELMDEGPRLRPRPSGREGPDDTKKVKTLEEQAREDRVAFQAQAGHVYVERTALDERLMPDNDYGDIELYLAQVSLWVHQDILQAVRMTNVSRDSKLGGVPGSPIKRLVSTKFRGYACNKQGAATDRDTRGRDIDARARKSSQAGTAPPAAGQAASNPIYVDAVRRAGRTGLSGRGATGGGVPMLTGRVTNQLYDVVHYEFTVVASAPDLLKLYENLLDLNYHTILNVSVTKADRSGVLAAAAREGAMIIARGGVADLYDYGPGPVVEATIVAELLIMADRTRGRWDEQANDWDKAYPPLMPVEFLKTLRDADLSALREKDKTRQGMTP